MSKKSRKVVIIGAGHVGTMCGLSLMYRNEVDDLVFIDIDKEKAVGQALDLSDAVSFLPDKILVRAGEYHEIEDADVIVMAAGISRLPGQTRLDQFDDTIRIMDEIISHMKGYQIPGILISISNPADIVADYLRKRLMLPRNRCFSTGTSLDSCRLHRILSELTGIDRNSIQAFVLGEHGDSQMVPFSAVTIGGQPFDHWLMSHPEIKKQMELEDIQSLTAQAGFEIVSRKGSTEFGIGIALSEIVSAIFHDSKRILPVSPLLKGEYGQINIHAGVPCILGKDGIEEIIELPLLPEEKEAFDHSCRIIREFTAKADSLSLLPS